MSLYHQVALTCDSAGSCVQQAGGPLFLANFEHHFAQGHAWKKMCFSEKTKKRIKKEC